MLENELRAQVERCRRLARAVGDDEVRHTLTALAVEYEQQLKNLQTPNERRSFAPKQD